MIVTLSIVGAVSAALVIGALIGLSGKLSDRMEGFSVAVAGGALIVALMLELVQPAVERTSLWLALIFLLGGAVVFTVVDYLIDEIWGAEDGNGLLLAVTFDGVPENLALGALLVSAGPLESSALAASILLSNLPEASAGARRMRARGLSPAMILCIWGGAAVLLGGAAVAGNLMLSGASEEALAAIRCVAAGAVVASLATEIFPGAFRRSAHLSGIGVSLGLAIALILNRMGSG